MLARAMTAAAVGALALLSACAAANTAAIRPAPEPECSFRSLTTCWTLAGRFPARRAAPPAPVPGPDELRAPPRAVVASAGDSVDARP